jgi:hypothetical protein
LCTVCGGGEGTLTTECCGRSITGLEEDQIYRQGHLDFKDGKWVRASNYERGSGYSPIRIVHCKKEPFDVLIDRTTKWGNHYEIGKDGTREEVVLKHLIWVVQQPELMMSLEELRGKTLGCWCDPKLCHGYNYVYLIEGAGPSQELKYLITSLSPYSN